MSHTLIDTCEVEVIFAKPPTIKTLNEVTVVLNNNNIKVNSTKPDTSPSQNKCAITFICNHSGDTDPYTATIQIPCLVDEVDSLSILVLPKVDALVMTHWSKI